MILERVDEGSIRAERAEAFHCFWRPELWPRLTSHVTRVRMLEELEGWQRYAMEVEVDGKEYVMETQRIAVPPKTISFQQPKPPAFMRSHTGVWSFEERSSTTKVTIVHRVDVDDQKAVELLGMETVEQARTKIMDNLRKNGMAMITSVDTFLGSQEGRELVRSGIMCVQ